MADRIDAKKVESIIGDRYNFDLKKCIEDINYNYTFPEDMCEGRTDWEDLKEQLLTAQQAVIELLDIIEKLHKLKKGE